MNLTVLITTSGIGERLGNITKYTNKSLVKVGDKYAICYIIECYDKQTEYIITIGYYGNYVKEFLLLAYPDRNFTFVTIDKYCGLGSSLGYSLLQAKPYINKPFIFHCCDAVIINNLEFVLNENTLYVCNYNNSIQYTNITGQNNNVNQINNKGAIDFDYIYIGICYIHNFNEFWENLQTLYINNANNSQLSDVDSFKLMLNNNIKFKYKVINNWHDTGNINSYNNLLQVIKPTYVVLEKNYESLCFIENKVIKFINDENINNKRIIRGNNLFPLVPKIYNSGKNFIIMELINGKLVSDIYQYNIIYKLLIWAKINLWINTDINDKYIDCCNRFYIKKTIDRIQSLPFLNDEKQIINGLNCINAIDIIRNIPINILTTNIFTQFHGDFILDNIIYTDNDNFKLIDWRHEFDNQLEYGDKYYDLAKLRHNIIFNHKNITNKLFTIKIENDNVIVDLKCNYLLLQQLDDFDKFVIENKYNLYKIKILTSIIWLNMAPLYDGDLRFFLFYFGKYNLNIQYNNI